MDYMNPKSNGGLPSLMDILSKSSSSETNYSAPMKMPTLTDLLSPKTDRNTVPIKEKSDLVDMTTLRKVNIKSDVLSELSPHSKINKTEPLSANIENLSLSELISKHNEKEVNRISNISLTSSIPVECTSNNDKHLPSLADLLLCPNKKQPVNSLSQTHAPNLVVPNLVDGVENLSLTELADQHFTDKYYDNLQNTRKLLPKDLNLIKVDSKLLKRSSNFSNIICGRVTKRRKPVIFQKASKENMFPYIMVVSKNVILCSKKRKSTFDFSTPSPDDIVKSRQRNTFERDGLFK